MSKPTYWLDLFTWKTWEEFHAAGAEVSGFRENRWTTVKKIKEGDYLLCYLTGVSRFIGILEVVSEPFKDNTEIWKDENFPSRLKVKVLASLSPETAVPITSLKDQLSIFQDLKSPNAWTGHVRGSPAKWKSSDGEIVTKAVFEAKENPVVRPVPKYKLGKKPTGIGTNIGTVTVPESEGTQEDPDASNKEKYHTDHTEIQWILLKLGNDMGLNVWVAKNDKNKEYKGKTLGSLPRILDSLPLQFDEATNKTIELIDVLWLDGKSIVASFEVESTTSIYSGLLRMSDLIAMQPNINIPLYIVAPDDRRDKVIKEVNRATFSKLSPPMNEMCRYISFGALRDRISQIESVLQYIKPDFLEDLSESCEIEELDI